MKLRDYQIDLINKVKQAWKDGYKCPCIVAPCGAGKSVILAEMAKRATENKRQVMFIVHRKELCEQINRTFVNYGVNMDYCKIWMVQTLKNKMTEIETPDLLLVDENHHALASTYRSIFHYFKCHRIGVTATPVRLDGSGLKDVNDILLESVSAKWLIENKFLSPAKLFSAPLIDLTGVNVKKGEFDQRQCEQLLDKSVIYGDIIESYRDKADGKKAIIYCVSVDYSRKIQEQFTAAGILTAHIDGTTPVKERDQTINDFKSGKIKVLTNCDIISEGFDVPDCECVMLLRPTKSLTLYIQQAMRSMRYMPNKEAIILDHVGNVFRFGLPWKDREWTLDGKKSKKTKKKDEEDNSFWTCERCFCTWAKEDGRICPDCDLELPISEREIEVMETMKLIEVTEDMFLKSRKEKRAELKRIQQERGYEKGWIWHRMQDFDKKHEEKIKKLRDSLIEDDNRLFIQTGDELISTPDELLDLTKENWKSKTLACLGDSKYMIKDDFLEKEYSNFSIEIEYMWLGYRIYLFDRRDGKSLYYDSMVEVKPCYLKKELENIKRKFINKILMEEVAI